MIDLERSKIAFGVSRASSWGIPFYADYNVECGCGAKDHRIFVEFEHDDDTVSIIFHKEVSWDCHWQIKGWWENLRKRISGALTVLLKGRLDFEEDFMLCEIEHIDGFIDALQEGKDKMLKYINSQEHGEAKS